MKTCKECIDCIKITKTYYNLTGRVQEVLWNCEKNIQDCNIKIAPCMFFKEKPESTKITTKVAHTTEETTKCLHCKHYMKMEFVNSVLSSEDINCLKLNRDLGNAKIVTRCNQFKPIKIT